jgi:hypothetical protein
MDSGEEEITDDRELQQVRRQARRVQIRGFIAGVVLTGLAVLLV